MDIAVIKFGGSSISDDSKLKNAAQKTISFLKRGKKVVVVLSAQGKTTDHLLKQAKDLAPSPDKRELDMLLSVGEQIACSKFAILLKSWGYQAISLNGWQAGILTNDNYGEATITNVNTSRIWQEFKKNQVVIVTGFQGVNQINDITTLGRNGSDTTAVALAAALQQKICYIFTDVDGVYDKDPLQYTNARKLKYVTYDQMLKLAENGAKVLHDKCVLLAKEKKVQILVVSSFSNQKGSLIY